MKTLIKTTSLLSGFVAIVSLILGVRMIFRPSFGTNFAVFHMTQSDTIMGFFGSLVSVAITCGGFAIMAYCGLRSFSDSAARKKAFVWGTVMSVLCLVSMIFAIRSHTGGFGDFLLLILPVLYTYGIFRSA